MLEQWYRELPLQNIQNITAVSGGDVNQAYRVETSDETYFLLVQQNRAASFYDAEVAGLKAFEEAGVTAPVVIDQGRIGQDVYLLLSYLEEGQSGSQHALGQLVAKLHHTHEPQGRFGHPMPFEGGDVQFNNEWTETWSELFINQRMNPLAKTILNRGLWTESDGALFEEVRKIMITSLKQHNSEPSLLHGDLWAGNYMFLTDGRPALFDPAPLYGDREFDLGATKVFGGFDDAFYHAYNEAYPLSEGAHLRIQFYELYLLMVHLVKFGVMYAHSVRRTMNDIVDSAT